MGIDTAWIGLQRAYIDSIMMIERDGMLPHPSNMREGAHMSGQTSKVTLLYLW